MRDELAQRILARLPIGVFTTDADGRITSFNPAAERATGLYAAGVTGRAWRTAVGARVAGLEVESTPLGDDSGGMVHVIRGGRVPEARPPSRFVTRSRAALDMLRILPDVAASGASVLVEGPSGSGKELVAREVHAGSGRAAGPFVAVNCAALPDTLLESELFGVRAGAYTDARRDRPGRFAQAEGGTLFLDEIGDVSPSMQAKLLRVLQEREYQPLGSDRTLRADVRVIAATNRDLGRMMGAGTFRDDLYWRLAIVRLSIPPLADRKEDVPLLVDHFLALFNREKGRAIQGVAPAAMDALLRHEWPGNVRELRNAIEHAYVMCPPAVIGLECLPPGLRAGTQATDGRGGDSTHDGAGPDAFDRAEAEVLRRALDRHGGHRARAAADLGIHRVTLIRKMKRLGLRE
ncbi:MAG: sigma 54-interacting transcriptional regulator [Deltaproteobacteria bacterium]|nr:sigma 54-interacting transcriptional regulator [Deltaproteobacteria bacterium]